MARLTFLAVPLAAAGSAVAQEELIREVTPAYPGASELGHTEEAKDTELPEAEVELEVGMDAPSWLVALVAALSTRPASTRI